MTNGDDLKESHATPEEWAEITLKGLRDHTIGSIDIMSGALALAQFESPTERLSGYQAHLDAMAAEVAALKDTTSPIEALRHVVFSLNGYSGDTDTYEDLQNANMVRVIDRRRGLPVALGILLIHLARKQGWDMVGLNFPGHFLLRLDIEGHRQIVDPFNQANVIDASDLRALLKAMQGIDAELSTEHYEEVPDLSILLRLQNNIKIRLIRDQRFEEAAQILDSMLQLTSLQPSLWREYGMVNAQIGNIRTAMDALQNCIITETRADVIAEVEGFLRTLRTRLN